MGTLSTIFVELKARNIRKTLAIYLSSALTAVGVLRLFTDAYGLPSVIFPVVVTILTCGLVSAFIVAWYHGKGGGQKFGAKEIALHVCVLAAAIASSLQVGGSSKPLITAVVDKSIAVLPFKNLTDNKEDEYFSDGITEDILTQLSKIGDLKVISRTSVMKYKDTKKNAREIGGELGVAHILEGSVRRASGRVRIVGQLINARTDEHLWAETYDRELKDVFSIQSEVAHRIAVALKARLSPDELRRMQHKATDNIDAYSYYLKGREYYNRYTKDDNERAIELFTKASSLDSTYALAYAGLGDAYAQRVIGFGMPRVWADSAVAASMKAIALDLDLAEGFKALGLAYEGKRRYRQALEAYHKAAKLNPNYAPVVANIGWLLTYLGDYGEALRWMKKSVALNPQAGRRYEYVGVVYTYLADDSSALQWFTKALSLQPDLVSAYTEMSYIQMIGGKLDEAQRILAKALSIDSADARTLEAAGNLALLKGSHREAKHWFERTIQVSSVEEGATVQLARTLLTLSEPRKARKLLDTAEAIFHRRIDEGEESYLNHMYLGYIASIRGDTTGSLQHLNRGVEMGYTDYRWMMIDPVLDAVRRTAAFTEMMLRLRMKVDEMRKAAHEAEAQQEII